MNMRKRWARLRSAPSRNTCKDREDLLKPQLTYPPLAALDIRAFFRELEWRAATFQQIRPVTSIPVLTAPPIVVPESGPEPEPETELPE